MSQVPETVLALVQRYSREERTLQSDKYGEADTRNEFIEPLFESLGWDVANRAGFAEPYKDVVNEYGLKVGGTYKAPDYAFRVGGTKKFFLEAKRPGVNIKTDVGSAYQLRRYGWTAKLPISVLTNFRHLAVYDCSRRPSESDNASVGRTLLVAWTELEERWDELQALLSKTAVLRGALDRYAAGATRRRGTSEVDDAFLAQMEEWRLLLARSFARRNATITVEELNEAVQQTIDRLVFLRIAEDRGIEPYGSLKDQLDGPGIYGRLLTLFQAADTRYNSGLFHFREEPDVSGAPDRLTPTLELEDAVLRSLIRGMYYPKSPYEFSVMPSDILGQVYEQFLGKVIRLTPSHQARVEDKPEVKKAGGVYYTPTHIVDHIVERTLGSILDDKTPQSAMNVTIVDPACGSGSFLLGAYDYLLNWFSETYRDGSAQTRDRKMYRDRDGEWRLTLAERKKILTSCLFGVDIDAQAVEVTKLSLMLKVLEGESNETLHSQMRMFPVDRVLPDLNFNVRCGNSLVGPDISDYMMLTPNEEADLRPFNWTKAFPDVMAKGGFHVVIGNPPYDVLEKDRGNASWPHDTLREYLPHARDYEPALGGKLNLYRLFLAKAIQLTRPKGRFGMIVPMSLVADISTSSTRQYVLTMLRNPILECFPQKDNVARRVFKRAKLSTVIVSGAKSGAPRLRGNHIETRVFPGNDLSEPAIENRLLLADCALLDPETTPVPLTDADEWRLCQALHAAPGVVRLGELTDSYVVTRGEINQTTYARFITDEPSGHTAMLKGVEVGPFEIRDVLSQGVKEWVKEEAMLKEHRRKDTPPNRRAATQRITGVDERQRLVAAIVDRRMWFADSTNSISEVDGGSLSLEYLVGLLNSDLMQWRFRLTSTNNNVGTNELLALPIFVPDSGETVEVNLYDVVCALSRRVAQLTRDLRASRSPREIDRLQAAVDESFNGLNDAVFELYGLGVDDRSLVTERLERKPVVALA